MLLAEGPADSVLSAEQVLSELMAIPGRQIPRKLLNDAQGIVIIPNVIKVGFVAGARRGHGVVMVRDTDDEWTLPQFVTLTGGSIGFQAGVQGTDVVLVFTTRKGVEGLMNGKFTVGADASVAAGPVGRETAVGTDAMLRSEIYSYSRSRGLFAGAALDGTALEIDHASHATYYGTPTGQVPTRIPAGAVELRRFISELSPHQASTPATEHPVVPESPKLVEGLRRSLNQNAGQLHALLTPEWRKYLALPGELQQPGTPPTPESLKRLLDRFARINSAQEYQHLATRPEFQHTYEVLREYDKAIAGERPTLQLPPPPQ
jgi:lipid-binding SYLF domain-containing protein